MIDDKTLSILKQMPMGSKERLNTIFNLYDMNEVGSECIGLVNIFNYGYLLGKREERARRKAFN